MGFIEQGQDGSSTELQRGTWCCRCGRSRKYTAFFSLSFSINCCNQAIGCDYRTRTRALLCNHVSVRGTRAFISLGYFNFFSPFFSLSCLSSQVVLFWLRWLEVACWRRGFLAFPRKSRVGLDGFGRNSLGFTNSRDAWVETWVVRLCPIPRDHCF